MGTEPGDLLCFAVEADAEDEEVLAALLSETVGGSGVEILDSEAGGLVREAAGLAPGRVLVRVYTYDPGWTFDLAAFPSARLHAPADVPADWRERWKAFFKPTRITARLVVRPPWEALEGRRTGDVEVVIEPGMAFGTGTHETTQLCLMALDELVSPGIRVLDVGCGSGVLGIAAVLLGASAVEAIDIDEEAVRATGENARANGVASSVRVSTEPLQSVRGSYEVVVANILSSTLVALAPDLVRCVRPGGALLLSGIPVEDTDYVAEAFSALGSRPVATRMLRSWALLHLFCPETPS